MENITKNIKKTGYACLCFDHINKTMFEQQFVMNKRFSASDALRIIAKQNNTESVTVADVLSIEDIEQMYSIPVEVFLEKAVALEKPNLNMISRTIKKNSYLCVVFDRKSKSLTEKRFILDKKFDADDALKILGKKYNNSEMTIADVLGCDTIEQLYGISYDDFIENATPVNKDDK